MLNFSPPLNYDTVSQGGGESLVIFMSEGELFIMTHYIEKVVEGAGKVF
jgi:hypothetical protein